MSQHIFETQTSTGRKVEVLIGFDRPLNGFFLVVTDTQAEDPDDAFVYSNLDDVELLDIGGITLNLEHFKGKLAMLGIDLPEAIESEVRLDRAQRVGNRVCWYDAKGHVLPSNRGTKS